MEPVRLVILGTGAMARTHALAFSAIPGADIVGAVDTRPGPLAAFCNDFGIPARWTSLEAALADGGFDAVANVTPDAVHCATTLPLLRARKHVLCEKPLAVSTADADAMADAAACAGVVSMVNMSYRNLPAVRHAARLVAQGAIGRIRHFEASYLQSWLVQPAWGDWRAGPQWLWRLSTAHGSKGVLGDVGIHILDVTTFVAGEPVAAIGCNLVTHPKAPGDRIGDYRLDANDGAAMHLRLAGGALGSVVATRFATGHLNDLRLRIHGDHGALEVTLTAGEDRLRACLPPDLETAQWRDVECPPETTLYARFIAAIQTGQDDSPDFRRGAELQTLLARAEDSAADQGRMLLV